MSSGGRTEYIAIEERNRDASNGYVERLHEEYRKQIYQACGLHEMDQTRIHAAQRRISEWCRKGSSGGLFVKYMKTYLDTYGGYFPPDFNAQLLAGNMKAMKDVLYEHYYLGKEDDSVFQAAVAAVEEHFPVSIIKWLSGWLSFRLMSHGSCYP